MLSAFAARKAAKEAAAIQNATPESHLPISPPPPIIKSVQSPTHTTSKPALLKRRPSASISTPRPTKRKKEKTKSRLEKKTPRYFEGGDAFKAGDDVIEVDSSSDSDSEHDITQLEDLQQNNIHIPNAPAQLITRQNKRAWSPSRPLPDSSDDEEEVVASEPQLPEDFYDHNQTHNSARADPEPSILSTFQPVTDRNIFHLSEDEMHTFGLEPTAPGTALILAPGETITLLGIYGITIVRGSISLLGVNLSPSKTTHRVFAPRSAPVPVIRCEPPGPSTSVSSLLPSHILTLLDKKPGSAVIILQYLDTGVEGLGRVCRVFDGVFQPSQPRSRWRGLSSPTPSLGIPGVHMVIRSLKEVQPFILPETWRTALDGACTTSDNPLDPPIYLIKGAKKSGKSTFVRTLLNRLLGRYQRVAFLECDLGQSEFTPGGMVALNIIELPVFGPPFTHQSLPYRAHYVGSTAPRSNPSHYLAAVQALIETYKLDIQFAASPSSSNDTRLADSIPLIVNTMGWTKGLGADLNGKIEESLGASDIFDIVGVEEKGWPSVPPPTYSQSQTQSTRQYELEGIPAELVGTHYNAIDQRNLAILSYFHSVFPSAKHSHLSQLTTQSWNTSLPLCACYPYEVDWSQAFDQVVLSGAGYEDVAPSEIGRVLNGAIVGLVGCDENTVPETCEPSKIPYTQGSSPPDPATSTCHGLALIRGVAPNTPLMHILTPTPPSLLQNSRLLVKGELELPVWGMLDFRVSDDGEAGVAGVERARVPFLQWGKGEGLGSERRRVRRNLMRRGQM